MHHKRVVHIWRQEGLKVPKKQPPRGRSWLTDGSCARHQATHRHHVWTYDFVAARTKEGRSLRLLSIVGEYTRKCLAIEVARHLRADDVVHRVTERFVNSGVPECIRSDNGPEFISKVVRQWLARVGVQDLIHRARKPVGKRVC